MSADCDNYLNIVKEQTRTIYLQQCLEFEIKNTMLQNNMHGDNCLSLRVICGWKNSQLLVVLSYPIKDQAMYG